MLTKSKVAVLLSALVAAALIAGCGSSSSSSKGSTSNSSASGSSSSGEPLRVALVTPSSGALAVFGEANRDAWELAAEEANASGGVAGHKVEITNLETNGEPSTTLADVRKGVLQDNSHFIGGIVSSPESAAVQPQLAGLNALFVDGTSIDAILAGKECTANAFHTAANVPMDTSALSKLLPKLPAKTWAIQAVDFNTGHNVAEEFKKQAEAAGDKVIMEQYAPLGTTDFGSYISKLKSSGAEGLFVVEYGADGTAFVNQGAQFELFKQFKSKIGFGTITPAQFSATGDKALGWYENIRFLPTLNNPKNKAFVEAFKKKFSKTPFYMNGDVYTAAQALFEAVKKAGSVEPNKVKEALRNISFESIYGSVSMTPGDGQLKKPTYLGPIVKEAGGPGGLGFKVQVEASGQETHPKPNPECKM